MIFFIVLLMISVIIGVLMYFIGYKDGFEKCKEIDDEIIKDFVNEKNIFYEV